MSAAPREDAQPTALGENPRAHPHSAAGSTLPNEILAGSDPTVEHLLVNAAIKVFRRHMMGDERLAPENLPHGERRVEAIEAKELRTCAEELCDLPAEAPPDLEQDLAPERMWILLDLGRNCAGLARQRATAELRDLIAGPGFGREVGPATLESLVPLLERAKQQKDVPVVFHILHLAAERALRSLREVEDQQ
jgi:hypothetical protein